MSDQTPIETLRDELELLGSLIRAERSNPTKGPQQCTDEQLERVYVLRDNMAAHVEAQRHQEVKREGPLLQMQDVLLACGELSERERVAVQWVLDRAQAQRVQVSYAMSKDYEALYDHLRNGGEALAAVIYTGQEKGAKWLRAPEVHVGMSLSRFINFGGIYVSEHGDHRAEFITSCTRLNLEWLAPAQPLDPDAHITNQDAYLRAKQERAKNTDFDGIEAARNPTLSVDEFMEVVEWWYLSMSDHPHETGELVMGEEGYVLSEGAKDQLRERLNKKIG
jgi:hypothetical protein